MLGDVRVHPPLGSEGIPERGAELVDIARLNGVAHGVGQLVELLHAEDRVLTSLPIEVDLRVDQPDVPPDEPRVAEHQVPFQPRHDVGIGPNRRDPYAVRRELEEVESAERSRVLILPAAADAQVVPLDRVGEAGKLPGRERSVAEHRQARHRGRDQGGRASEAAARRRLRPDRHLDPAGDADPIDRGLRQVHDAVVDGSFVQVVLHEMIEVERTDDHLTIVARHDGHPHVVVDRGGQHRTPVLLEVVREIGPSADEADAKGRDRVDRDRMGGHGRTSLGRDALPMPTDVDQATWRCTRRRCCSVRPPQTP